MKEQREKMKYKILISLVMLVYAQASDFTRDNDIVTDNVTKLQWQDEAGDQTMTWKSAIDRCEALILGGHSDWRLPNINELRSIIDRSKNAPAIADIFAHTNAEGIYLSSTSSSILNGSTGISSMSNVWVVWFDDGYIRTDSKSQDRYVRCVRDGQ